MDKPTLNQQNLITGVSKIMQNLDFDPENSGLLEGGFKDVNQGFRNTPIGWQGGPTTQKLLLFPEVYTSLPHSHTKPITFVSEPSTSH